MDGLEKRELAFEAFVSAESTECSLSTPPAPRSALKAYGKQEVVEIVEAELDDDVACRASGPQNWAITDLKDVKLGKLLSETLKSRVFLADWKGACIVAKLAKPQDKEEGERSFSEELAHEVSLMSRVGRHPDLVRFLGAYLEDAGSAMFVEYMPGGDLQDYYCKRKATNGGCFVAPRRRVLQWGQSVARGLGYLHECHIIHRDLKPMNIFMSKDHREVKLADFGLAKLMQSPDGSRAMMSGGVGTWRYMAPEVLRYQAYDEKADIFSFALVLFFMSAGQEPFHENAQPDWMLQDYLRGKEPRPNLAECHSGEVREIMARAWHCQASKRPSAYELAEQLSEVASAGATGCAVCPIS